MLGEKIADFSGTTAGQRVLADGTVETTVNLSGLLLGVQTNQIWTYVSEFRPDGSLSGEGHGVVMGEGGEAATGTAHAAGRLGEGGSASWRGVLFYESASEAWGPLNGLAGVLEFDTDAAGNATGGVWEWN